MENTETDLDLMTCLRAVQVDTATGIALVSGLIAAAPADPTAPMARAIDGLTAAGDALQCGFRVRTHTTTTVDLRPYDVVMDRAWAAMVARLNAWSQLPAESHPEVPRAATLATIVAPDGLQALKLGYRAQWATLKTRLDEVNARGLDGELVALAGASFVREVRERLYEYGRVQGLNEAKEPEAEAVNLTELLRVAQQRVTEYVVQVFAAIDPQLPATRQAARRALRPLLEARDAALAARKPGATQSDAEPTPDAEPKGDAKSDAKNDVKNDTAPVAKPSKPPVARPSAPPPA